MFPHHSVYSSFVKTGRITDVSRGPKSPLYSRSPLSASPPKGASPDKQGRRVSGGNKYGSKRTPSKATNAHSTKTMTPSSRPTSLHEWNDSFLQVLNSLEDAIYDVVSDRLTENARRVAVGTELVRAKRAFKEMAEYLLGFMNRFVSGSQQRISQLDDQVKRKTRSVDELVEVLHQKEMEVWELRNMLKAEMDNREELTHQYSLLQHAFLENTENRDARRSVEEHRPKVPVVTETRKESRKVEEPKDKTPVDDEVVRTESRKPKSVESQKLESAPEKSDIKDNAKDEPQERADDRGKETHEVEKQSVKEQPRQSEAPPVQVEERVHDEKAPATKSEDSRKVVRTEVDDKEKVDVVTEATVEEESVEKKENLETVDERNVHKPPEVESVVKDTPAVKEELPVEHVEEKEKIVEDTVSEDVEKHPEVAEHVKESEVVEVISESKQPLKEKSPISDSRSEVKEHREEKPDNQPVESHHIHQREPTGKPEPPPEDEQRTETVLPKKDEVQPEVETRKDEFEETERKSVVPQRVESDKPVESVTSSTESHENSERKEVVKDEKSDGTQGAVDAVPVSKTESTAKEDEAPVVGTTEGKSTSGGSVEKEEEDMKKPVPTDNTKLTKLDRDALRQRVRDRVAQRLKERGIGAGVDSDS